MKRAIWSFYFFIALSTFTSSSYALSGRTKFALKAGAIGAGVGTALGGISYPFTGEIKTVFLGSSVGLYLGLIAGIYFAVFPDEAEQILPAFIPSSSPATHPRLFVRGDSGFGVDPGSRPGSLFSFPVFRF